MSALMTRAALTDYQRCMIRSAPTSLGYVNIAQTSITKAGRAELRDASVSRFRKLHGALESAQTVGKPDMIIVQGSLADELWDYMAPRATDKLAEAALFVMADFAVTGQFNPTERLFSAGVDLAGDFLSYQLFHGDALADSDQR